MAIEYETFKDGGLKYFLLKLSAKLTALLADKVGVNDAATDSSYGLVKLNSVSHITLNDNGQLEVGGRLGYTTEGGLYSPVDAEPVAVGRFSLLISEAKGLSAMHREFIIAGGSNVTLKSAAAAGATQYRVSNTQNNRFVCACFIGGRLAIDEESAKEKTVEILSVTFANGGDVVPSFGATVSNNDIIITVAETLNPSGTLTAVRGYGTWKNADIISAGQGNQAGGGKTIQCGQALLSGASNNQVLMMGIRQYSTGNNSILVGSDNISKKTMSIVVGQGHDTSSGKSGVAVFGLWSSVGSTTALAVGNGTAYNARKNIFEVRDVSGQTGVIMISPNGTKYQLAVDDSGNLSTTAVS